MNCEVVQGKLSCYLDGVVDEATMEMIEDHLQVCSECRAELAALQALSASMGSAFEVEPPAGLKASIKQAIDRERIHSPECEMVLAMLSEFVDGEIGQDDRIVVQQHVDECENCAQELVMMQRTSTAVRSLGEVDSPITLKAEIAAAVAEVRRNESPLSRLIRKARLVLHPAGLRWTAGAVAAAAVVVMATILPMRQRDIVTVSEKPTPQVASQRATPAPDPEVAVPQQQDKPTAVVVAGKPVMKPTSLPEADKTRQIKVAPKLESETVTIAVATTEGKRLASEALAVDSSVPGPGEPVAATDKPEAPKADKLADAASLAAGTEVIAVKPEEKKNETPSAPVAATTDKPAPVVVASEKPADASQDDKDYIRRLKEQIRMKRRDDGIKVDLLDLKF